MGNEDNQACEPTKNTPDFFTTIILSVNVCILIGVSIWSYVVVTKDEKFISSSFGKKVWIYLQDLWKKRGLVIPMLSILFKNTKN